MVTVSCAPVGIPCPPVRGNTFGMAVMHCVAVGSVMLRPMRSGPGESATVPSSESGPSSVMGSEFEVAMLSRVGWVFDAATVMQYPLMSRILMVIGHMMSIASPRVPAKTASVPMAVGKGQLRTASIGLAPGTSSKKATWLTRPDSQMLAMRVMSG